LHTDLGKYFSFDVTLKVQPIVLHHLNLQ